MKRPEGFDRSVASRPAQSDPSSAREPQDPEADASQPTAPPRSATRRPLPTLPKLPTTSRREAARDAADPGLPPASSAAGPPAAGPIATAPTTASSSSPAPAEPARIEPVAQGDGAARERARDARRLARRAAAARRAVERTEVRRFTRRTRHRRAALITAAAVVVALVGSVTISVFSPLLSLQTITVEGTTRVDKAEVLRSLDGQIGKPLALIDFDAVKTDLAEFPLIESYVTETMPPHTLVIRVTERSPIASVKVGKTYELVDPAGVVITTSTKRPAGVPLVSITGGSVDGAVFRSTAEVLLSLPAELLKKVSSARASTADDVTFKLSSGELVVWGSADESTKKALLLTGLIKDHQARNPTQSVEYDVSAPDNGIIRTK